MSPPAAKMPPEVELLSHITGLWRSRAVYVAAKLGVADALRDGPRPVAEIAAAVGAHPGALHRLLRALASLGIFAERGGRFELTPMAEQLRSDRPGSLRAMALTVGGLPFQAWGEALHSVQTGRPAFEHVYGTSFFDHLAGDPESSRIFDEAMNAQSGISHAAIVSSYDFSGFATIVDVGGGQGVLLERILRANPKATGVVYDQAHVVDKGRTRLAGGDLGGRLEFVAGSFFDGVPEGGDAYLLAMVIHDWDDVDAVKILSACRRAMPAHGKLLLSELVIPPGNAPFFGKLLDLDMLVSFGGKERTADEYRTLFKDAGFSLNRIVPAYGPMTAISILEGAPA
jgi:hypothetical protein